MAGGCVLIVFGSEVEGRRLATGLTERWRLGVVRKIEMLDSFDIERGWTLGRLFDTTYRERGHEVKSFHGAGLRTCSGLALSDCFNEFFCERSSGFSTGVGGSD